MGIIGILVATSVPSLLNYSKQVRLKTSTREIIGLFSLARSLAISSRSERTIAIDPDAGELTIEETVEEPEPRRVRLASSVKVTVSTQSRSASGPMRVVFQPSGALKGPSVSLTLASGPKTQTILVTSTTGGVFLQPADQTGGHGES